MNDSATLQGFLGRLNLRQMLAPLLIVLILSMMVLPLPTFVLDVFFTFNIAISIMVLLVAMYTKKPLDFAIFPTVLLVTTLLRLSLNVASTRVVLLHGHTGPDAAGKVIEAFGHFLVGGNYAVGIVVFIILTLINFIVITKGAGRIAEVAARFTLDAMPGKQMAIDADLNAGLIGEDEARKRRATVALEADFYGSMDGASKFVRGDAVAGILILLINIIGGLIVGVLQHDMSAGDAAKAYTLLTIGDGLVAQIPALIISTAAGLVVTRVATEQDIGQQLVAQLFGNPMVLALTALILGTLGLIPGMPNFVFLMLASVLGFLAWRGLRLPPASGVETAAAAAAAQQAVAQPAENVEASWSDVMPVDVLGLEVGYRLIPLVDRGQDGELLKRIRGLRKKFAQEIGFLPAPVHIRDNLELRPNAYRLTLKGVPIGDGEAFPGQYLAINPGRVSGQIAGTPTQDPAFGLPAVWIDATLREQANVFGYTVVDASTVIATHLNHVILSHATELLGRQETQALLDHLAVESPKLVEDMVPKQLPLGVLQRVLQYLLEEGVNIRDMRTIIETLAEHAPRTQDPLELTSQVRIALGRAIVQQLYPTGNEMQIMALDPGLERIIGQALQGAGDAGGIEPVPQLKVIANGEVPDSKIIKVTSIIGASK
jgi:flagellar biosynthesis protein FlhA